MPVNDPLRPLATTRGSTSVILNFVCSKSLRKQFMSQIYELPVRTDKQLLQNTFINQQQQVNQDPLKFIFNFEHQTDKNNKTNKNYEPSSQMLLRNIVHEIFISGNFFATSGLSVQIIKRCKMLLFLKYV